MSQSLFRLGQTLRGRLGKYAITKRVQETVWLAKNQTEETVVIKGVQDHPRVENERDVLKHLQNRTPFLQPLIDEIDDPSEPSIIVLRHLYDHLLNSSINKTLNRKELRCVSRCILEAPNVLYEDGYVHTDIKLDNIFLGDLGGAYPADSKWAREGTPVGAPMWSSPEVLMETPWNTATDIWSFGAILISLIYGGNFNLFRPKTVPYGHEEYNLEVLKQKFRYFGPFPGKYEEIASPMTVAAILYLMQEIPQSKTIPFYITTEREVCKKDKEFIGKIMMMDSRDRPTAIDLLKDEWFKEDNEEDN